MSPYTHLTLKDRESILVGIRSGKTLEVIAKFIGRSKSTISREISRNGGRQSYSASDAQARYERARVGSRRPAFLRDQKFATAWFDTSLNCTGHQNRLRAVWPLRTVPSISVTLQSIAGFTWII